ncbi:hypothetical protein HDK77DRAFT_135477, partial [Phyllosticta capitalensis]
HFILIFFSVALNFTTQTNTVARLATFICYVQRNITNHVFCQQSLVPGGRRESDPSPSSRCLLPERLRLGFNALVWHQHNHCRTGREGEGERGVKEKSNATSTRK